ncbi:hypothetical protein KBI23_23425 [bacterium]|nr:hypothetical protein [bacterium]MBP9807528.1 hypothetical protein [bacterium]
MFDSERITNVAKTLNSTLKDGCFARRMGITTLTGFYIGTTVLLKRYARQSVFGLNYLSFFCKQSTVDNGNTLTNLKYRFHKQLIALVAVFMLVAPFAFSIAAVAQTSVPSPGDDFVSPNAGDPSQGASQTQPTAENIYDAPGQTNLVTQQAEQNTEAVAQNVEQQLWPDFGAYNDTYQGIAAFWGDDIISNLFANIGQLIGKWLSEFINGWVADAVQFLTGFLRIFVLNPNIAVNGLSTTPGGPGAAVDDISPYVRQGADIMYGIAVDLLLLLFILCIWKYWADAAIRGNGNMMGAVGRLIFTAGLLLAWPTIYAFEIQITNEMIKALYFNSADQVAMLDAAMAAAVKGGLVAGAGLLANATAPVAGQVLGGILAGGAGGIVLGTVGTLVAFVGLIIYLVLGGILIAELIYILVLKAIQTALLTAQYMFAPLFLVFFALPDTENVCSGFVRSFVEVSLWTFVWVGMLKILVIVVLSDFNPWGKIVMAVGVLQLMIQVPSFLARAQISPMSDFVSAGLITGGLLAGGKALGGMLGDRAKHFANAVGNFGYAGAKGAPKSQGVELNGLANDVANPGLLKDIRSAQATGKVEPGGPKGNKGPGAGGLGPDGKPIKPPEGPKGPKDGKGTGLGPDGKPLNPVDPNAANKASDKSAPGTGAAANVVPPGTGPNKPVSPATGAADALASAAKTGTGVALGAAAVGAGMAAMGANSALNTANKDAAAANANAGTGEQASKELSTAEAAKAAAAAAAAGGLVNAAGNLTDKNGKELTDAKGQPIKAGVTAPPAAGGKPGEVVKDQATVTGKVVDPKADAKGTGAELTGKGKDLASGINPADIAKGAAAGAAAGAALKAAGDEVEVTGTGDEAGKAVASSVVPGLKMAGSGTPGTPGSNLNADGSVKTTVDGGKGVGGAAKPLDGAKGDTSVVPKPGSNPVTAAGDKSVIPPINSSQLASVTGSVATGKGTDPTTAMVAGEETLNPADPGAPVVANAKEGTFTNKPNTGATLAAAAAGGAAAAVVATNAANAMKTPGVTPPGQVTTDVNGKVVGTSGTPGNTGANPTGNVAAANLTGQTGVSTGVQPNPGVTPAATSNVTGEEIINADPAAQALAAGKEGTATLKPGGNPIVNAAATAAATAAGVVAGQGIKTQTGAQTPTPPAATTTDVNGRVVSSGATPNAAQPGVVNPNLTNTSGIVPPMANAGVTPAGTSVVTGEEIINADPAAQALAAGKDGTATLKPGAGNPLVNAATTAAATAAGVVAAGQTVKTQAGAQTPTPPAATTTDVNGRVVSSGAAANTAQPGVANPNMQNITPTSGLVPPMANANTGAPLVNAELVEEAAVAGAAGAAGAAAMGTVRPTGTVNPSANTGRVDGVNATGTVTGRVVPPVSGQPGATVNQGTVNVTPGATRAGTPPAATPTQFTTTAGGTGGAPPVNGAQTASFAGGDGGDGDDGSGGGGNSGGTPQGGPAAQPTQPGTPGQKASMFDGYMQAGYRHVPYRVAAAAIRLAQGATLGVSRSGKPENVYDNQGHLMHIRTGEGASDEQKGMQIMAGAYGELMSTDAEAYDAARQSSIDAGEHKPKGMAQRAAAGILAYNGSSWTQTAAAKQSFARSMAKHAALGSQAYINGEEGNAYTEHLVNRYGPMSEDQQAWAAHIMTSTDSPESGWSWRMGPATEALIQSGLPITPCNRAVAANQSVLKAQPWLRGATIRGGGEYMQARASAELPEGTNGLVQDAWYGNRAQAMPAEVVQTLGALAQAGIHDDNGVSVCRDFNTVDQVASMVGANARPEDYVGAYNSLRGGNVVMANLQRNFGGGGGGGGGNMNLGGVNIGGGGGSGSGSGGGGNVAPPVLGGVTMSGGGGGGYSGGGGTADVDLFLDGPSAGAGSINPNAIPLPSNLPTMQGGPITVNSRIQPPSNQGGSNLGNLGSVKLPGGSVGSSAGQIQIGRVDGGNGGGGGSLPSENVSIDVEQSVSGQVLDSGGLQQSAVASAVSQFGGSQNLVKQVVADLRANGMDWKQIYDPSKDESDPGKYQMLETAVQAYSQNPSSMPAVAVAANAVGASNVSTSDVQVVQSMMDADPRWQANNIDYGSVYTARAIVEAHRQDPQTYGDPYLTKDYVDSVRQDPRFVPRPVPVRNAGGQVARYDQSPVPKDRLVKRMMERMFGQDGYNNGNG